MGEKRIKLGYDLSCRNAFSFNDATLHLKCQQFDSEKKYFEFLLNGSVTSDGIRSLLSLPYEIALTEANGKIALSTGLAERMGFEEDYMHRMRYSKISFHTHPIVKGEIPVITPSFADVCASGFVDSKTTLGLAHANGVMVYRRPMFDPDKKISCKDEESRWTVLFYCENRGIDVFGRQNGLKRFFDLSDAEQVKLQRQFAEETQMIVDEASWEDQKGLERVLSRIFDGVSQ